jgi:ABC-type cobalamin/Fe3+-siderophores transport system ATPase subunit
MSDRALIQADNLTKRFGSAAAPAIDRLSARIVPGQFTGVVGPHGAGKTTLLRLFAGLLLPSDGRRPSSGKHFKEMAVGIEEEHTPVPAQEIGGLHVGLILRIVSERQASGAKPSHHAVKCGCVYAKRNMQARKLIGREVEQRA